MTPDPIGLVGGLNPFLYTEANPLNRIDPFGLDSVRDPYTGQKISIPDTDYVDLYKIKEHLNRIKEAEDLSPCEQAPEHAMLKRLKKGEVTFHDYEFYMHEQIESQIMKDKFNNNYTNENIREAHIEALQIRDVKPKDIWHPFVIDKYKQHFPYDWSK